MLLTLAAIAALAAPPTVASPTGPPPAAAPGAAAAPAAPPASVAGEDAPPSLEQLQQIWQASCGDRGYGAYDDICNQISDQIRQAERDARRRAAHKPPAS